MKKLNYVTSTPQVVADNNVVDYPYTVEDMCTLSGNASVRTFKDWVKEMDFKAHEYPFIYRKMFSEGRKRYYKYSETALEAFQDWRKRNQAYQGRSSKELKDTVFNALGLGDLTLEAFEDEKVWEELNQFRRVYLEGKQNEQRLVEKNKALTVLKAMGLDNLTRVALENPKVWDEFVSLGNAYVAIKQENRQLAEENRQLADERKALTARVEDAERELDDYIKENC